MTVGRNKHELFSVCHHDLAFISQDRNFHLSSFSFHTSYVRVRTFIQHSTVQFLSRKKLSPTFYFNALNHSWSDEIFRYFTAGLEFCWELRFLSSPNQIAYAMVHIVSFFLLNPCEPLLVFYL